MAGWDIQIVVGGLERFAADERDPRDVPEGLTFSTSWQGGDKLLSWTSYRLPGDAAIGYPFAPVEVVADGGASVLFEGEMRQQGRSSLGNVHKFAPQALGYAARFEDRGDFMFLGIDRELNRWKAPSAGRSLSILGIPLSVRSGTAQNGVLELDLSGTWTSAAGRPWASLAYDARPLRVGRVVWQGYSGVNIDPAEWVGEVHAFPSPDGGGTQVETDFIVGPAGSGTPSLSYGLPRDITVNAAVVEINAYTGVGTMPDEDKRSIELPGIGVIGDHGIPVYDGGTGPESYGIRTTDYWAWIVNNWCAGLTAGRIVVENDLLIQHLVELSPTTPGAAWNNANAYHGNAWDVRRGRVNCHPFGDFPDCKTWLVRSDDPAYSVNDEGLDASEAWTGVLVTYTTPAGEQRSVGPSWATAMGHSDLLEVTSPSNPAVAAGIRRIKPLALDVPTDETTAIMAGVRWLQDAAARQRKGKLQITGHVWDDQGVPWPCFHVRGGHFVRVVDSDDPSPRRILETTYDHDNLTLSAELDDTETRYASFVAHLVNRTTGRT